MYNNLFQTNCELFRPNYYYPPISRLCTCTYVSFLPMYVSYVCMYGPLLIRAKMEAMYGSNVCMYNSLWKSDCVSFFRANWVLCGVTYATDPSKKNNHITAFKGYYSINSRQKKALLRRFWCNWCIFFLLRRNITSAGDSIEVLP